jgi:starch synthase
METYKHADAWRQLMLRGMSEDFSWSRSAEKYVDLYHKAIASRVPRDARRLDEYGVSKPGR